MSRTAFDSHFNILMILDTVDVEEVPQIQMPRQLTGRSVPLRVA